ncbi:MAG TPA: hypothetical protein PKZ84_06990 [Anaerolineae bacterium]|nr:hypothetical protein [Anaerolineae bacterium]HQI84218.1 hypothetical protein [Anaerolineae bacterium]
MDTSTTPAPELTLRRIAQTWWPLAFSWLLMSVEGPAHSAIAARLANPEVNLAAWGGIVFPLALIIEAPIIMLLPASTALSKDLAAYVKVRRFMMYAGAFLTAVHVAIAFTPLYDVIARNVIGAPEVTIEPGRIGLMIMTPWSWAIAFRRTQQGLMIRFGHPKAVGIGTIVRLSANGIVLLVGYLARTLPGIVVASSAVAVGVVAEAIYAGLRARPIIRQQLRLAPRTKTPLTLRAFLAFYVPLAMTSLISLLVQPIGSATMSRLPRALDSLAVWPVLSGLLFVLRSGGIAYKEAVISLLDEPNARRNLRRFAAMLTMGGTALLVLIAFTPLARLWFGNVMALSPTLLELGQRGLIVGLFFPAIATLDSWFQGLLMHRRHTRSITEGVILYTVAIAAGMGAGIALDRLGAHIVGVHAAVVAFQIAWALQVGWLWWKSKGLKVES